MLGCPVLAVLALVSGCATENTETETGSRLAFVRNTDTTSQVQLTMRDIRRPVDPIIGTSAPTENVAIDVLAGAQVDLETDENGALVAFELVASPLKGVFDNIAFDSERQTYAVRGLGWLDATVLLTALNETFAEPEYDYYPNLELCNANDQTNSVVTQLTFEVGFVDASGELVQAPADAVSVQIAYTGATVQSSVICGLTFEDGARTEVQIELAGGFEADFANPPSEN